MSVYNVEHKKMTLCSNLYWVNWTDYCSIQWNRKECTCILLRFLSHVSGFNIFTPQIYAPKMRRKKHVNNCLNFVLIYSTPLSCSCKMEPTAGQSSAIDRIFTRYSISTKKYFLKPTEPDGVYVRRLYNYLSYNYILNIFNYGSKSPNLLIK